MRRRWHIPGAAAVLAIALFCLSCDRSSPTDTPLNPPASGALLGLPRLGGADPTPQLPRGMRFIEEERSGGGQDLVTGLFGLLGGELHLNGESLLVPEGAVLRLTLFTMETPDTKVINVNLSALTGDLLRNVLSLLGLFQKPVTVELSYAHATNVTDPGKLVIVRLLDDGKVEVLPTRVDRQRKVVSAQLDHFSKYAMASN